MKRKIRMMRAVVMSAVLTALIAASTFAVSAETAGDTAAVSEPAAAADSTASPETESTPAAADSAADSQSAEPTAAPTEPAASESMAVSSAVSSVPESEAEPAETEKEADILVTADVNGSVTNFGAVAAYRAQLLDSGADVLTVDAGNAYAGNSAIISIMNSVPYDFAVPGDTEFTPSSQTLSDLNAAASFQYILSNYANVSDGTNVLPPYAIGEIGGRSVAFVGVDTPASISGEDSAQYDFSLQNLGSSTAGAVASAKAEGADMVFLVLHLSESDGSVSDADIAALVASQSGISGVIAAPEDAGVVSLPTADGTEVPCISVGQNLERFGKITIAADGAISCELVNPSSVATDSSDTVSSAYANTEGLVYEYEAQFGEGSVGGTDLTGTDSAVSGTEVPTVTDSSASSAETGTSSVGESAAESTASTAGEKNVETSTESGNVGAPDESAGTDAAGTSQSTPTVTAAPTETATPTPTPVPTATPAPTATATPAADSTAVIADSITDPPAPTTSTADSLTSGTSSISPTDAAASAVRTGDTRRPLLYAILVGAAAAVIAAVLLTGRKKKR